MENCNAGIKKKLTELCCLLELGVVKSWGVSSRNPEVSHLLEVGQTYAEPHDIAYNTTKTVCMLVKPKHSQDRRYARARLRNEELSYVDEFRYLGNIITADCWDDKDVEKQFRRQNAVGNMLVRKFSFAPMETKIQLFKSYCYLIYGCALWPVWKFLIRNRKILL